MSTRLDKFPEEGMLSLTSHPVALDLAESVGPDVRLADLIDASELESLLRTKLGYGTAPGDLALRQAIAQSHGVQPEQVVVTVGAMHALSLMATICSHRGARILTSAPLFPLARNAMTVSAANVDTVRVSFDDSYRLDVDRLCAALTRKTGLVVLASPQNPSGVALSADQVATILSAMDTVCPSAFLLIDETYREANYRSTPLTPSMLDDARQWPASVAAQAAQRMVSCASLSKCHGAPGLRIGWVITRNQALRDQLVLGKFHSVIACSGLDEALALRALQRAEQLFEPRRALLAAGLGQVSDFVALHQDLVQWVRPDAGALCCLRLRAERFDLAGVNAFHRHLSQAGARVAPGEWFDDEPHVFRLGFGALALTELKNALEQLGHSMRATALTETLENNR